ncbi:ATP-binding protein [Kitasatospora sp. NPDC036755]|uniref:ATP-binding protein n=1 Tax=Kitasatospora sp. NPDC036755 TaxID=3154600 RepID=UPI0034065897
MLHRVLQIKTPLRTVSVGAIRTLLLEQVKSLEGVTLTDDQAYALRLCASEFVTNASRCGTEHGGPAAELVIDGDLDLDRSQLRVTVTDPRLTVPDMGCRDENLTALSGRGVTVAAGYAEDVGWHQRLDARGTPTGWSVWFNISVQLETKAFGEVTARTAEVPPEPVISVPSPSLGPAAELAHQGFARRHWKSRRPRGRTAA